MQVAAPPRSGDVAFITRGTKVGVLRVMNAAVSHVHAFRAQAGKVLREWE